MKFYALKYKQTWPRFAPLVSWRVGQDKPRYTWGFWNPFVLQTFRMTTERSTFRWNEIQNGKSHRGSQRNRMLIRYMQENLSSQWHKSQASRYSTMLDGNVLLRQKHDEVPKGTLSCPERNMEYFHLFRHYEGIRLLPSACDCRLIQQTLNNY